MATGTASRKIELVSIHRTMTASSARLALASATMLLNRIISGSFLNCGAPPDSEMTVATRMAPRTLVAAAAARAATHSRGPGMATGWAMRWNTVRATTPHRANWAMLNARLIHELWRSASSAPVVPTSRASMYMSGVSTNSPTTPGSSLNEKACRSRRKRTSTTLTSPR